MAARAAKFILGGRAWRWIVGRGGQGEAPGFGVGGWCARGGCVSRRAPAAGVFRGVPSRIGVLSVRAWRPRRLYLRYTRHARAPKPPPCSVQMRHRYSTNSILYDLSIIYYSLALSTILRSFTVNC